MKYLKMILLSSILIFPIIIFNGCHFGVGNNEYTYSRKITVETNLSKLRIDNLYLDSTSTYPYLLDESKTTVLINNYYTVYPIDKNGYMIFKIYGGEGYGNSSLTLKDSLLLNTPIDTTGIFIQGFHFIK